MLDLTGQRFGKLTVIKKVSKPINLKKESDYWLCKCDCGNEKILITQALKGYTNKRKSISCGCLKTISDEKTNNNFAENRFWNMYITSSFKKELEFTIAKEEIIKMAKNLCFYCGEKPKNIIYNEAKTIKFLHNGIDRVDNSKGYILENCVPCCEQCNKAKRTMNIEEFKDWVIKIYNNFITNGREKSCQN